MGCGVGGIGSLVKPRWNEGPTEITLVRHAQSAGNEADARAREAGAEQLDLRDRDADVPLSATGSDQVESFGRWLQGLDRDQLPTVAVSSPYRRALETATALRSVGLEADVDERLRERDLGAFDGLTGAGIRARHPEEAARRRKLGKFYYEPPSGESWADVVLRVRSFLDDLRHGYDGERVWLFTHQAVIMCFRYVLEDLSERDVLDLDREVQIPNASVSTFVRKDDGFVLERFGETGHLEQEEADVTRERPQGGHGDEQH
jgi:broad specificity phosphatase PhoE